MKFLGIRAEIDLVRNNPDLFHPDHQGSDLARGYDLYTKAINMLNRHARRVASKEIEPDLFDAVAYDAELRELPVIVSHKKAPESDMVLVPKLRDVGVDNAKELLTSQGLKPVSNATAVELGSKVPVNIVTTQSPDGNTSVPKGTSVVIEVA
ncbi:PASTA domain-containing protein [Tenggerimyces flavus]|uniref:PASTA domain-containing protein n=1 Tax=Tenggerimyces flavus TaxID=1708749 RepID=A0ABV7YQ74_9ACTN|nr:PASTA domain-containing protein [Tenggerimyces flavus]MBM7790365.1 hypothetical protein [Tenggerimyces flavus]